MAKRVFIVMFSFVLLFGCLPLVFAAEEQSSFGAYDHVFIIGIDGAGSFIQDGTTPNFNRIFADGAVDYRTRTEMITVSAQNWGSILSGVSYLKHVLTNNKAKKNERAHDTTYPTVFTLARQAFPEAELASFVNWDPINHGIIENNIGVNKHQNSDDAKLTEDICNYFNAGNAPKLFFVQYDSVDHVGHEEGSRSANYFKQIQTVDGYLGKVYDCIEANGLMENGLFIVVSDHGHMMIGGHFGLTMRETMTTLAVKGKHVISGSNIEKDTRNRDVAAITLHALGLSRPSYMTAKIPDNLFTDVSGETRSWKNDVLDTILSSMSWIITLSTAFMR